MLGLIGIMFNIPIERRNRYFCSQFVSEVLLRSGVLDFNIPPALVQPTHFYNMNNKNVIYSGLLSGYRYGNGYNLSKVMV